LKDLVKACFSEKLVFSLLFNLKDSPSGYLSLLIGQCSVSDPHTLNADPDPGLWLNTDPRSGSRTPILIPNQAKKIFLIAPFVAFHSINIWLLNPMLSSEKLV